MFQGCKCTLCKCAAVSVVCCCFMAVGQHEEYCEHHYRPAYCNMPWDLSHGQHNDHPTNIVRSHLTVVTSTSGDAAMVNPDFVFKPPD